MSSQRVILGLTVYHGDVSAALVRGGELVAAVEEERFRRVKHWAGFPEFSIRRCLEIADMRPEDITDVAVSRDPWAHWLRKLHYVATKRPSVKFLSDRLRNRTALESVGLRLKETLGLEELPPLHNVEHHRAHLASAYYVSPFSEAAACAVDGFGDFVSTSTALGCEGRLKMLGRVFFPHSLGLLYTAITQFLGFPRYGDEFKVMGLAPYGRPVFVREISHLVQLDEEAGTFELDLAYFEHWRRGISMEWDGGPPSMGTVFSSELESLLGPRRQPGSELTQRHEDIACSLQEVFERVYFHILTHLAERTGQTHLCLAGGCAMNSVANGKVLSRTPFRDLYVQPAAADNGTSLGAAFAIWHEAYDGPRSFQMTHGYWGTEYQQPFSQNDMLEGLDPTRFEIRRGLTTSEVCEGAAQDLVSGRIVGWFQGRMEWGARALGNRSILADPRRPEARGLINEKIKMREKFRPFAPAILAERVSDYFEGTPFDPFMQQVHRIRPEKREEIPAVTHVDGTGRLQSVTEDANPLFHSLIRRFAELTGVPVLLNTSFNENEPIVESPAQALDCFLRTRMDVLVIGDTLIRRR